MRILSSWDLINGKTADKDKYSRINGIRQPIQSIPSSEKDEDWIKQNIDWWEWLGIQQLKGKSTRIVKNYRLAKGIIDKSDYMLEEKEGTKEGNILSSVMTKEESKKIELMELSFFPIIPNVVNLLTGEFSKRNIKTTIKAIDAFSKNEKLEQKKDAIMQLAEAKAKQKIIENLLASGYQPKSEEEAAQLEEQMQEAIANTPEVKDLQDKNYRSMHEQWGQHRMNLDEERFKIYEKENITFRDLIVTDSEFWHIRLHKDDYELETWSPLHTFHYKSPDTKYISEGLYAGRILMMTLSDIIDTFREDLTPEHIEKLEQNCLYHGIPLPEGVSDEKYYDETRSKHDQGVNSIAMQQHYNSKIYDGGDMDETFLSWLNQDMAYDSFNVTLFTVTELYWKSYRKVGILYEIDEEGILTKDIVTDEFEVTEEPIFDNMIIKEKNEKNLIYGQYVQWFYINQVFRGKKINSVLNQASFANERNDDAIYLGGEPLPFQFKSEESLWNAKIPVEGISCTDQRLNVPVSKVDLMKPYQIMFNLCNNQIKDILIDEEGTVVVVDPKFLPKRDGDDDWGDEPMAKARLSMKEFKFLPLDGSLSHTGERTSFSHFQQLDLEESNRLFSRMKVAEWAKYEAFSMIGITPERMGSIAASQSATGTQQSIANSYSQTESLFVDHISFLMPRVKEMMLNAAQYYAYTGQSKHLEFTDVNNSAEMFKLDPDKILPKDIGVFTSYRPDINKIVEDMKMLIMNNNTTNASIYDLLKVLELDTPSAIVEHAKKSVEEFQAQQQEQTQAQQNSLMEKIKSDERMREEDRQLEMEIAKLNSETNILEAQIRALGFSNDTDLNKNQIPDQLELDKFNADLASSQRKLLNEEQKMRDTRDLKGKELLLKNKELEVKKEVARNQLRIAKENRNKHDIQAKKNKK